MLLHRCFNIVSHLFKFHFVVETLKNTLYKNASSMKFADNCISKFLNNMSRQNPVVTAVPKLELTAVLPYLGNISSSNKARLTRSIGKRMKFCKLQFIFQTNNNLDYFRLKYCVPAVYFVYKL